jgi:hypothetical protein
MIPLTVRRLSVGNAARVSTGRIAGIVKVVSPITTAGRIAAAA